MPTAFETNTTGPIQGTTMFDGAMAMKGYGLNKMCYSFNNKENREEFLADEMACSPSAPMGRIEVIA